MSNSKEMKRAKEIVKEVSKKFSDLKNQMIKEEGFFHPEIHVDSSIDVLIDEFEEITGEDWDKTANSYL